MTITRLQLGTLRKLRSAAPEWVVELRSHDFRGALLEALQYEIATHSDANLRKLMVEHATPTQRFVTRVVDPYVKLCIADYSAEALEEMVNLAQLDVLCDHDREQMDADLKFEFARWNLLSGMIAADLTGVVDRVARLEVDLEFTTRILEWRHAGGALPAGETIRQPSAACPGDEWIYGVEPDGTRTVRLSRAPEWDPEGRPVLLPTEFRLPPGP